MPFCKVMHNKWYHRVGTFLNSKQHSLSPFHCRYFVLRPAGWLSTVHLPTSSQANNDFWVRASWPVTIDWKGIMSVGKSITHPFPIDSTSHTHTQSEGMIVWCIGAWLAWLNGSPFGDLVTQYSLDWAFINHCPYTLRLSQRKQFEHDLSQTLYGNNPIIHCGNLIHSCSSTTHYWICDVPGLWSLVSSVV